LRRAKVDKRTGIVTATVQLRMLIAIC
jgi:hypothetical protein